MRILLLVPFLIAAAPADRGKPLPTLTPFDPRSLPALKVYRAARGLSAETVLAHRLNLPAGVRLTGIGGAGFPLELGLSDGRCFMIFDESFRPVRERVEQTTCDGIPPKGGEKTPPPPRAGLRPVTTQFAFTVWRDDRRHLSLITDGFREQLLAYYTSLEILGMVAFRDPVANSANLTIVARYRGKIFITSNDVTP